MADVRYIKDYLMRQKTDVQLFFNDKLTRIRITSMNEKITFLDEKYENKIPMDEYVEMIDHFKVKHPNVNCVNF